MIVKQIIEMLSHHHPDDELCVLYWDKEQFDYRDDEHEILTTQAWAEICKEFDEWEDAGHSVSEWIADAVIEKVELVEEEGITKSEYASKMGLTEEAVDNWEEPDA